MNVNIAVAQQQELLANNESVELLNNKTADDISNVDVTLDNVNADNVVNKNAANKNVLSESGTEKQVEVGKHLNTNLDAMSMVLSLLLVLAAIIGSAMLLKRFQTSQQHVSGLKIITSLPLGNKERIVVVQAGEKQLVLGVTAQQITLLESLDEPLTAAKETEIHGSHPLIKLLQKRSARS